MIATLDLRGRVLGAAELAAAVPRAHADLDAALPAAAALIDDVRTRGSAALLDQAERFDNVRPERLLATGGDLARAEEGLDPEVRQALLEAIARVRKASAAQVPPPATTVLGEGAVVHQRWQAVQRVGLYVPGGKAVYPSSVIMNVVPAQIAGVKEIVVASPPQADFGGSVHPTILGAASLLGVSAVYAMGGAGAIGALAYGVPDIGLDPVQMITGPGNIFVASAKRLVKGVAGIDSEAGPTEILIIADDGADPRVLAADLVSQAEHDEMAATVLVTDSAELAARVTVALAQEVADTRHSERVRIALGGAQSALVLVDDLDTAARFSNAYGPEHLEIQTADPGSLLPMIESAGAIFLGAHSPVSLGDYLAGSNHVLPTGGQSRFASGLGAYTFLRPQQVIEYSQPALGAVKDAIVSLAESENLPAHGDAVRRRFSDSP